MGRWIGTGASYNLVLNVCERIVIYITVGSPVQGIEKDICS